MRISIRPTDSGYRNFATVCAACKSIVVKFNGAEQIGCDTADAEAGMIVRYTRDDKGAFTFDRERQAFTDEVLHGKVEIEIIERLFL